MTTEIIPPVTREDMKKYILSHEGTATRRTIKKYLGISSKKLDELYDEALADRKRNPPRRKGSGMPGRHYQAFTVISESSLNEAKPYPVRKYICRCACGNEAVLTSMELIRLKVPDCGCGIFKERRKSKCTNCATTPK